MEGILTEIGAGKFEAIMTDNAVAMVKAKDILHENYENISVYGCVAHTLHLLIGDISKMETMPSTKEDPKAIAKEINKSHILSATFKKYRLKKMRQKYQYLSNCPSKHIGNQLFIA
ncbi:hypothetical protein ILUMI_25076 [Ignelater luminosus]|uniref:DUF659 domain-containing protein n=1 Tax=Ignelater luminosus TaxID=2038154 RepID=A0A8K0C622_IGNLU|nr:hypothetical protein ILUMI_25076 [Ignelater luminosus]